jgi:hypothetical protein
MKMLVGLLTITFATVLLPGQTRPTNPAMDRLQRMSKGFPPEMAAGVRTSGAVRPSRSNCVYSSAGLGTWSLSVRPCQASPKLELFPAFEKSAPGKKPAGPRGDVR